MAFNQTDLQIWTFLKTNLSNSKFIYKKSYRCSFLTCLVSLTYSLNGGLTFLPSSRIDGTLSKIIKMPFCCKIAELSVFFIYPHETIKFFALLKSACAEVAVQMKEKGSKNDIPIHHQRRLFIVSLNCLLAVMLTTVCLHVQQIKGKKSSTVCCRSYAGKGGLSFFFTKISPNTVPGEDSSTLPLIDRSNKPIKWKKSKNPNGFPPDWLKS
ncbi:hypothetical protein EGR_05710 [Echinococcus granulosus]|uniref:Uncharacterized protein n=1 Tax=Echinococcus granulosus TaxID=6210 RepID=W6V0Y5_ECHGR|nr:hypothetical protein EGR_05710 [Echinococcus granulosus]EUB59459.1 hypothetical protein EGR_05710 [Echinococcus granulosus]